MANDGRDGTHASATRLIAAAVREGRTQDAMRMLQAAVARDPHNAVFQVQLGRLLAHAGKLDAAASAFRTAAGLKPEDPEAPVLLGQALARAGRLLEARDALRLALSLVPRHAGVRDALADLEFRVGFPEDALPLWLERLQASPDDVDVRLKAGETLSRLGHHARAAALYRAGLALAPGSAELWLALGQAVEDDGDREAASDAYARALALRPGWPFALACQLALARGDATDALLDEAGAGMRAPGARDADRAMLGYAIGKARDARGDHAGAMSAWRIANAARQREIGPPDPGAMRARIERTIAHWPAGALDGGSPPGAAVAGSEDARPVFVVGMPRSGTTLTEQILAGHPAVHGCGELPDLAMVARRLPADPRDIDQGMADEAIARYLAAATRHAPAGASRLVDKEPLNYFHLGLVALLFPRARVVWCRRDPRDVAVSIHAENFALDEVLATDFGGIAHYINGQQRLMRHWQSVLPLPIHVSRYEDLVSDPEGRARALVDFLGLPWDPACLDFHRGPQNVQSPSRWQVREPVHGRSIGRWRHYEDALTPLVAALEPDAY